MRPDLEKMHAAINALGVVVQHLSVLGQAERNWLIRKLDDMNHSALAEHEEPGVPTVDECERVAFKAGFRAGVQAALRWSWPEVDDVGILTMTLTVLAPTKAPCPDGVENCPGDCAGAPANYTGVVPNAPYPTGHECDRCSGTGLVRREASNLPDECGACHGTGILKGAE